ncbi:MAG: type II toxin-antitoxin system RelE/ParE family toxin [Proteobacteria bacterium]|nr:type II toxin-antitoxin system RelE/ParE family toxin [Pseudomonadota bacterium]
MPRVTRRPLAEADVLEIWDYIADDGIAAADRWVDRLDKQFRVLAMQPMMGRVGWGQVLRVGWGQVLSFACAMQNSRPDPNPPTHTARPVTPALSPPPSPSSPSAASRCARMQQTRSGSSARR